MQISALKRYQRPRGAGRFADLLPDQRAAAEAHYRRLCAKWGHDLPQWRRAILTGRARDLVLRPRDAAWGRALRKRHTRQPAPSLASPRATPPTQVAPSTPADTDRLVSRRAAVNVAFSSAPTNGAPSSPSPSTLTPPSPHAVRLDIRGLTARGTDGQDSATRILRDVEHAFGQNPRFTVAVPGKDLPPGWVWRLEVVPVR